MKQSSRVSIRYLLAVAGLGGLLYGVDFGVIAAASPYIKALRLFTDAELSWIVGAVLFGGIVSSLTAGMLAERFGRKRMIIVSAALFLAAIPVVCLSERSLAAMLFGRVLQGMSAGYMSVVMPMYLTETLPAEMRGRGTGVFQFCLGFGLVAAAATDGKIPAATGLSRSIAMDVDAKSPEVEKVELPKRIVSDTGELVWDNTVDKAGVWTVDTSNTKVFSGFPKGREFDLGGVKIAVGETKLGWATVSLVSHDATGFGGDGRAAKILLAATGLSHNSGAKFSFHGGSKISCRGADWGKAPVVNEGIPARITLPAKAGRVKCRALDERGAPKGEVPVTADANGFATVEIGPKYATVWYEVDVVGETVLK